MNANATELDNRGRHELAEAIGDTPETVMDVHRLRRGLCRALVTGPPQQPHAAVIQPHDLPAEPAAYGNDAEAIWHLLQHLDGWSWVNTSLEIGPGLATLIEAQTGRPCSLYGEIYYILERPVAAWPHPEVRRLTMDDLPVMEAATIPLGMQVWRFGSAEAQLRDGVAAGAVIDGELVSTAFVGGRGDRYADVSIVTREDWRLRGLSTAAAAMVCAEIQRSGQIPVWSTGWDNYASQRVAAKLGFEEVSRRVYVGCE